MADFHKTSLLLVMYTLIICTQQQKHDPAFMKSYGEYLTACAKEVGLEEAYVKTIWKENHFPNDPKLKCYFKCMSMKLGVLTQAGEVVDAVLKAVSSEFVDDSTDREIVDECGAIEGTDLCETAYKLVGCIKAAELD